MLARRAASGARRSATAIIVLATVVAALVVCAPLAALANGRFPRADRLVEDPRDPNRLVVAATYGIVTTADRGRSWHHICEASFAGFEPYVGDPILDLAGDGAMLVDVQSALNISVDQGCTWSPAFGGPGRYVPDFTIARDPGRSIFALYAASEEKAVVNRIVESIDHGKTFHIVGTPLPLGVTFTIDVPASDPSLIYVSGLSLTNAAELAVSADDGATWISRPIPLGTNELPYIAAIDPHDPRKIFLRVAAIAEENGLPTSKDALFVTSDGGESWREVFRASAQALGFALSPEGDTVLIGYGDPRGELLVDPSVLGIYRSSATIFDFSRLSTTSTTCLAWTATGIYVCTSQFETGHALAFAKDENLSPDGRGLEPLLDLRDVTGPLICCASPGSDRCVSNWPVTCAVIGACDGGAPPGADACASDAQTPPMGDADLRDAAAPRDDDAAVASSKDHDDGCSCSITAKPSANEACFAAMLTALAAALRRNRGRSRRLIST